jgi:hypothetical protein
MSTAFNNGSSHKAGSVSLSRQLCRLFGHNWDVTEKEACRQNCKRNGCKAYRKLTINRLYRIGESPFSWHTFEPNKL